MNIVGTKPLTAAIVAETRVPALWADVSLKAVLYTAKTQSRRWMFGRILGSDGHGSYRELRLELLCCLTV